jgi:predicted PurR-regulated permease PerM
MVSASNQQGFPSSTVSGRSLFRIVSFACIAGFVLDMLTIALPLNIGALEWRVGLFQKLGDRSIILLIGAAFLMLGTLEMRALRKQLSLACLGIGMTFLLFSVVAIRDGVVLQKETNTNITNQSAQAQEQIEKVKANPPPNFKGTPQQIEQASKQITAKAEAVQKNANTQILKTGISSVGNLAIVGISLIGIGRYGMRSKA